MNDNHPEVLAVELGGKARRVKLGPAAFRLAALKHDVHITMAELSAPSLATLAQLVWIGLLPDDPDLDESTVLVWMADADEGAAVATALKALSRMTDGLTDTGDTKKKPTRKRSSPT